MKKPLRRLAVSFLLIVSVGMAIFLPVFPWSARCRHVVKRVLERTEMRVAAWRGTSPGLITLSGKLVARQQAVRGAEIEALDSRSGWATLANADGEFILPDVQWYPRATYTLIITLNDYQRRQVEVEAPARYPTDGTLRLGELELKDCCSIDAPDMPGRNSVSVVAYDRANHVYYQSLFEELTAARASDEERLATIAQYVAGRLTIEATGQTATPTRLEAESPRRVLESGSRHCSQLAMVFATIAEAGNYKTRIIDLIDGPRQPSAHMVVEVYYGDRWHLYDPVAGVAIRRADGRVASYREVRLEASTHLPQTIPAHLPALAGSYAEGVANLYRSGLHHYYYLKH